MNAKTMRTKAGKLVEGLIYAIGCITIWHFTIERWPPGAHIVATALIVYLLIWYFWVFFVRPFRAGLRGEACPPEGGKSHDAMIHEKEPPIS